MEAFYTALANVFSWPGITIPVLGTLLAMVASFLPGLGNASVAVLALVLSADWDPVSVMLLFGALTGGATFMGSITAILFNIPGSVSSTPALLDGYPMAKRGLPKTAIACAATASAVGSIFGVLLLLVLLPLIEPFILAFGPLEIFLVALLGLLTVVVLPSSSRLKSAIMVVLGLLAAMVGSDPMSGQMRWTFGSQELSLGLGVIPVMLGVYTVGEILHWTSSRALRSEYRMARPQEDSTLTGIRKVLTHWTLTLRCSWIGSIVGMVPGIGGSVAGFLAYGHAVQSSPEKERSQFGLGEVRGLIAPEAAVDAKDGGSLLPTLALGLPGSEACVILLAVFAVHGLVPGVPMLTTHLALSYTLIFALLFSNILTSVVGVAFTPFFAKFSSFQLEKIALPCLLICLFSVVLADGRLVDLYTMILFGVVGYFWRCYNWPVTTFVIAFALGKLLESNLFLTVQLIDMGRVKVWDRGLALSLMAIMVIAVMWLWLRRDQRAHAVADRQHNWKFSAFLLLVSALMLYESVFSTSAYTPYAQIVAALSVILIGADFARCVWYRLRHLHANGAEEQFMALPHRRRLSIICLIPLWTWLLGFGFTMGLTSFAWILTADSLYKGRIQRALAVGALIGLLSHWAVEYHADVLLEKGWLWRQIGFVNV